MTRKIRQKNTLPDKATDYARSVIAGETVAGPSIRAACKRHLDDLVDGPKRGFVWDIVAANRVIGFFHDVLRLNGGEHEGRPFDVEPWEAFVLGSLFGWKNADGYRRFRVAFIETGKGSGKSPLAAGIGIYMLVADDEPRAEVYAAATKRDQAMILFRDAVAMVDQSPKLKQKLTKSGTGLNAWNLAYLETGSFFRPISSENTGKGQSGPRPHCALLDEVHEHPTNAIVEFMRAGTKGRRQALIFMITNSGTSRTSVCYEYHDYGCKVSRGDIKDDTFFSFVCDLDEGDDPFKDKACWKKVNPTLGITIREDYLEEQVTQARGMPSKEGIVRRLNFCQWTDATSHWVGADVWDKAQVEFDPEEMRGRPLFSALDLSSKRDLTARADVWIAPDGTFDADVHFWTPLDTMDERARADKVPYREWSESGFLEAVPGRAIDYQYPARSLATLSAAHDMRALAYDQWRMEDFQRELDDLGIDTWLWEGPDEPVGSGLCLVRHGQGYQGGSAKYLLWMPRSVELLEEALMQGKLRIRQNPVLTYNSSSAVLVPDPAGNRKWEKRKSTGRIDGIVALCMAVAAASFLGDADGSVYEERGLIIV
jgi:phage terminase large subunit-like protein